MPKFPNRRIEIYAGRKGLLTRKQWFARLVSTKNGKHLWRTSEGYNNLRDLQDEASASFPDVPQRIVDAASAVRAK